MTSNLEYHPLSNLFPLMEGEEFNRLVDDIKKNGLLEPIVVFEDKILDGRNRYRACIKLKIIPTFKKYPNRIEAFDYVVAENIRRRHLNEAQISEIALEMAERRKRKKEWDIAQKLYKDYKKELKEFRSSKLQKVQKKGRAALPPKKIDMPKYGTAAIREISKELPISHTTIYQAKKIKEVAKTEPKIAEQWEGAKRGEKGRSIGSVYNKALQVGQPPKVVRMDDKMINRFQQFNKEIRLKLRKDLLIPYTENTKAICKRYVRLVINYLMNEFEIGGVIDG